MIYYLLGKTELYRRNDGTRLTVGSTVIRVQVFTEREERKTSTWVEEIKEKKTV